MIYIKIDNADQIAHTHRSVFHSTFGKLFFNLDELVQRELANIMKEKLKERGLEVAISLVNDRIKLDVLNAKTVVEWDVINSIQDAFIEEQVKAQFEQLDHDLYTLRCIVQANLVSCTYECPLERRPQERQDWVGLFPSNQDRLPPEKNDCIQWQYIPTNKSKDVLDFHLPETENQTYLLIYFENNGWNGVASCTFAR
jgi:hypothetical protein